MILAFYVKNMFSLKKVIAEEKEALMVVTKKVIFKLPVGFVALFWGNANKNTPVS